MSKSLGNVVSPEAIMKETGNADVLRLWALLADQTRDVSLGPEALKTAKENLRKLRNVARFLVAVAGGDDSSEDPVSRLVDDGPERLEMEPLDEWMLASVRRTMREVRHMFDACELRRAARATLDFWSGDVASVYLEAVKDRLYAEPRESKRRAAAAFVLEESLRHFCVSVAPLVPFLAEETHACAPRRVFSSKEARGPGATLVESARHLALGAVRLPVSAAREEELRAAWDAAMRVRALTHKALLEAGKSSETSGVVVTVRASPVDASALRLFSLGSGGGLWSNLDDIVQASRVDVVVAVVADETTTVSVSPAPGAKCARCRRHHETVRAETKDLCSRCAPCVH